MGDTYGAKAGARIPDTYPGSQQWDTIALVQGSDATTTGQVMVDITGLALGVVHNSTYEFEVVLKTIASADVNGINIAFHATQTPVSLAAWIGGNTSNVTFAQQALLAVDSAAGAFNTTSTGIGIIVAKGAIVTHATLDGTFSVQHLKVTSGTSTIKVGSALKLKKVA